MKTSITKMQRQLDRPAVVELRIGEAALFNRSACRWASTNPPARRRSRHRSPALRTRQIEQVGGQAYVNKNDFTDGTRGHASSPVR